jgi:hypothetical protein
VAEEQPVPETAEWLDLTGVQIEPFHWDEGPNSELKRRDAGKSVERARGGRRGLLSDWP